MGERDEMNELKLIPLVYLSGFDVTVTAVNLVNVCDIEHTFTHPSP